MKSLDVKVWSVRKRDTKTPSYGVRWSVAGNVFSESFRTKALADHYRTKLMRAMRDGEESDTGTGLPVSMKETKSAVSWYDFALRYLAMKWPHAAPNTRGGINESLTSVTMQLLGERPGRPSDETIRRVLRKWAFVLPAPNDCEVPDDVRNVLHWVSKASRPLADLAEPATARAVLDALKLRLDGTVAAAETVRRKRRTLVNAANCAVDLGELRENPITAVRWQKPKVPSQVDPRVVANPEQARNLLAAVSYVGGYRRARGRRLVGLFAALHFGGLRPAEAVGLVETDLNLPIHGWGSALLHRTRPSAGKQWTDSGETHDDRGLKNRPTEDVRRVPIPPHLVVVLREHLATFGTADDVRLFFSEKARSPPPRPTTACGRRPGSSRFRRLSQPHRLRVGRTTFGTRRCRRGSTRASTRPRWSSGPVTVLRSSSLAMRSTLTGDRTSPTGGLRICSASTTDAT
ncbi:hypothetical protein SAMN05428945_0366 [Streptomyces sp. 2224.1]|nr:hypothetical protein SAMN05428945_0366 [Streptomyces sp. 2224.1]